MFEVVKLRVRDLAWEKGKTMQRDAMWDNRHNKALRIRKDPWIDRRGEGQRGKLREKKDVDSKRVSPDRRRSRSRSSENTRAWRRVPRSSPTRQRGRVETERGPRRRIARNRGETFNDSLPAAISLSLSLSLSFSLVDSTMDKLAKELDTSKRSNRHATDAPSRPRVDDRLL